MSLDTFGQVQTRLDTFGQIQTSLKNMDKVTMVRLLLILFSKEKDNL